MSILIVKKHNNPFTLENHRDKMEYVK